MTVFDILLEKAQEFHGEMCPGIVLGTRMTMAGLRGLGMDPLQKNGNLVVYVEIDRCAVDAIQAITGVSLGKRTLKHINCGKFAGTFVDTRLHKAVRVSLLHKWPDKPQGLMEFGKITRSAAEEDLFRIQEVSITIPPEDMPGFPTRMVPCSRCDEQIMDGKEEIIDGVPVCKNCAHDSYYSIITC